MSRAVVHVNYCACHPETCGCGSHRVIVGDDEVVMTGSENRCNRVAELINDKPTWAAVHELQEALNFWLPTMAQVPDYKERIANDACLLMGYCGKGVDEPTYYDLLDTEPRAGDGVTEEMVSELMYFLPYGTGRDQARRGLEAICRGNAGPIPRSLFERMDVLRELAAQRNEGDGS